MNWLRKRRIRKLEDRISDKEYLLQKWGWARNPSYIRREEEKIAELKQQLRKLKP